MTALDPAFLAAPLAHRAYHDREQGRPENSRAAVRAAIARGYGIETDVQLSADGHVVVLHDLLKLSDWQPPCAPPAIDLGSQIQAAAAAWVAAVAQGDYQRDGGVYHMRPSGKSAGTPDTSGSSRAGEPTRPGVV